MSKRKLSRAEQLAALPAEDREAFWASLTDAEKAGLEFDWEGIWARPEQREPPGSWRTWMYLAGRGAGKTRTGAEWIRKNLTGSTPLAPGRYRHACLLAETAKDARSVVVGDGLEASNPAAGSGIMQICPKDYLPNYEPSKTRLTFPNGAVCSIFNAVEYDGLRGFQFDCAWVDELAKFAYAAQAWDQLQFCLRLGKNPRVFVSTTPRPTKLIKAILADPTTFVTRGSTFDNLSNLSAQFLDAMRTKYEGTRLGQQELHAAILEDVVGALWKRSDIDAARITVAQLPILRRLLWLWTRPLVPMTAATRQELPLLVLARMIDSTCLTISAAYSLLTFGRVKRFPCTRLAELIASFARGIRGASLLNRH
jgi:phage terminase large subunit-like protein